VAGRLARARAMLADRLARRGLSLPAGALAAHAAVPAAVVLSTIKAAGLLAAAGGTSAALAGKGTVAALFAACAVAVACAALAGPLAGGPATAADEKPALTGVVRAEKGGPLEGVRVRVWTAGPRGGVGDLCPSCYPDCGKQAVTDKDGRFAIKGLDPRLTFTLLVAAKGHVAFLTERTDPRGGALDLALKPHGLEHGDPATVVSGRVTDDAGRPVADATVQPTMFRGKGRTYGGFISDADPLAVTDERGHFQIGLKAPAEALYVTVYAPFHAPLESGPLAPGGKGNELKMVEGATVRGRVLKGGKPLAGVALCLRLIAEPTPERLRTKGMLPQLSHTIATDKDGVFTFLRVTPDENYVLVGLMDSFRPHGSLKARGVGAKGSGTITDLGDLVTGPGSRVAGQLVLADGEPVPAGTRVGLTRREEGAFDWVMTAVGKDGTFEFTGVPDELCQLDVLGVKGYRVSAKNYSCDRYHGHGLWGRVDRDITGLRFLLEPGAFVRKPIGDKEADDAYPRRKERLRGASTWGFLGW
ncbi:MAG: hypothetical protein ACRC33_28465, partial [Gemmataceae bacterium]